MSNQNYDNYPPPPEYGQQTSSLAVISLVAGIASYFIVPLLGAIAAVITGNMAKKEIRQSSGRLTGEDMAQWGLILGWINIGISLVGACFLILAIMGIASLPLCIPWSNINF